MEPQHPPGQLHTGIAPQQSRPLKGEPSGKLLPPLITNWPTHRCTSQSGLPQLRACLGTLAGRSGRRLCATSGLHPAHHRREPALGRRIARGLPRGVLPVRKARRRGKPALGTAPDSELNRLSETGFMDR